jgi:hypothetical protein
MQFNAAQLRIIISALQFQVESLRRQHATLMAGQEDEIAELTDDILSREGLLGELETYYQQYFLTYERQQA